MLETQIELWEWMLLPFYLVVFLFFGYRIQKINLVRKSQPHYKYFVKGLAFKFFGVVFFSCIYLFYYKGGDTIMYYQCARAMSNLMLYDFGDYLSVISSDPTPEVYSYFNDLTGRPYAYIFYDEKTCLVSKITSVFLFFGFQSYLLTSVIIAFLSYLGTWKLYDLMVSYYPEIWYQLLFSVIFVPSIIFWGSGILKDTFTFFATCVYIYSFNKIFLKAKYKSVTIWIAIFISLWVLLNIKPYIFMMLMPTSFLWILFHRLQKTKNILIVGIMAPIIFGVLLGGTYLVLNQLGDTLSKFSLDSALETAQTIQTDMQRSDQYGANSFNVGQFDGSVGSALSLFPMSAFAGLFRPMIFEAGNIVMLLSGAENLLLLGLTVLVLIKIGVRKIYKIIKANPYLIFALSFSIFFAFVIGLTTANFGALVRFKIPLFPMYLSAMFILIYQGNVNLLGIRKIGD